MAHHWNEFHCKDTSSLIIQGIDKIVRPLRDGDKFGILCKQEVRWIITLNTRQPLPSISNGMYPIFINEIYPQEKYAFSPLFLFVRYVNYALTPHRGLHLCFSMAVLFPLALLVILYIFIHIFDIYFLHILFVFFSICLSERWHSFWYLFVTSSKELYSHAFWFSCCISFLEPFWVHWYPCTYISPYI